MLVHLTSTALRLCGEWANYLGCKGTVCRGTEGTLRIGRDCRTALPLTLILYHTLHHLSTPFREKVVRHFAQTFGAENVRVYALCTNRLAALVCEPPGIKLPPAAGLKGSSHLQGVGRS